MTTAARSFALALLVVGASTARGQAKSALPGWTITTNMTVDSGGVGHATSLAIKQQVTTRNLRLEYVQMSGYSAPMSIEGMYTIIDAVDSTMTSIMPSQHIATVMGFDMLSQVKTPFSGAEQNLTRSDLEDLGDGGSVNGRATRHYRLTTAGTMTLNLAGEKCTTRMDNVTEMWIASDVDLGPAFAAAAKQFGVTADVVKNTPNRGVAPAAMPKGTALRSISKRSATDPTGKPITITTTTDVIDFAQTNLDPAVFALPTDVQTMDMRKLLAQMPAGMLDSAANAISGSAAARAMCSGA